MSLVLSLVQRGGLKALLWSVFRTATVNELGPTSVLDFRSGALEN